MKLDRARSSDSSASGSLLLGSPCGSRASSAGAGSQGAGGIRPLTLVRGPKVTGFDKHISLHSRPTKVLLDSPLIA